MTTWKLTDKAEIEKQAELVKQMILRYGEVVMTNGLCGNQNAPSKQYKAYRISVGFSPDSSEMLDDFMSNPIFCISMRKKIDPKSKEELE